MELLIWLLSNNISSIPYSLGRCRHIYVFHVRNNKLPNKWYKNAPDGAMIQLKKLQNYIYTRWDNNLKNLFLLYQDGYLQLKNDHSITTFSKLLYNLPNEVIANI